MFFSTLPTCCSSVAKLCPALCDPSDCSTPGFPVLHCLPESAQHMSIESVMTSGHLILCCPLLLLPSTFPSIKVLYLIYYISLSGTWIILKYLLNCKRISNVPKDKMERWIDIIKDLSQLNEYISVN